MMPDSHLYSDEVDWWLFDQAFHFAVFFLGIRVVCEVNLCHILSLNPPVRNGYIAPEGEANRCNFNSRHLV